MLDKNEIARRLRVAKAASGVTNTHLSELTGASQQAVGQWFKTGRISTENLIVVCQALGLSLDTLLASDHGVAEQNGHYDPTSKNDVMIAVAEISVPADLAQSQPSFVRTGQSLPFQKSWLDDKKLRREDVVFMQVQGDSMRPTLSDGDMVLVDVSDRNKVIDGKIYAVVIGGEAKIKRLKTRYDGALVIMSDNQQADFDDEVVPREALSHVWIMGRARHRGGDL